MQTVNIEISKERYEELSKVENLNKKIEPTIDPEWKYGYGWYGCNLATKNDKYYIAHKLGDSCD